MHNIPRHIFWAGFYQKLQCHNCFRPIISSRKIFFGSDSNWLLNWLSKIAQIWFSKSKIIWIDMIFLSKNLDPFFSKLHYHWYHANLVALLTYLINSSAISIITILVVKTSIIPFRLREQIVKALSWWGSFKEPITLLVLLPFSITFFGSFKKPRCSLTYIGKTRKNIIGLQETDFNTQCMSYSYVDFMVKIFRFFTNFGYKVNFDQGNNV